MVPGKIIRFLDTGDVAIAGTRDKGRVPRLHRVSAWAIEPDGETLACAIPENYTYQLIENLDENGQFAVTISEVVSHETYQFKGEYIGSRAPQPDDITVFESVRERFAKALSILAPSIPVEFGRAHINEPAVVVRCKVREIFLQTPGPGAGRRVYPPEDR